MYDRLSVFLCFILQVDLRMVAVHVNDVDRSLEIARSNHPMVYPSSLFTLGEAGTQGIYRHKT